MATPAAPAECERLAALRKALAAADHGKGVHAYIVPTEDPHMSEYSPEVFKRREYITKFTGTAGWAVVTAKEALLWTDGRYFLQASQELGKEWTLMKAGMPGFPDMEEWLALNLPAGGRVGIDPLLHTVDSVRRLNRRLQEEGKEVVALSGPNLVDVAWGAARPPAPATTVRVHDIQWAGETVASKVDKLRAQLKTAKADVLLVSMLDEVMWLLNIRGSDVDYNPVALSYALVRQEGPAALYVDASKVTPAVAEHLQAAGVQVRPYDAFLADCKAEAAAGKVVMLDTSKVSFAVYQAVKEGIPTKEEQAIEAADGNGAARKRARTDNGQASSSSGVAAAVVPSKAHIVEASSPVVAAKAIKNEAELAGMREAHLRDAVALCDFISWLETEIASGKTVTEVEVDEQLTARRAAMPGFVEPSFSTIAGANSNGAIIHYRAQPGTCKTVDANSLLLLDSGGQYECGTTDITRTMHFGAPTDYQRRCYTRVLQGHIGLDTAIFPEGVPGAALDAMARLPLWKDGLNYRHGTGHGVGAALNVHEGPQAISMRFHITTPLAANMIVSNEPGYYEDGSFGIRIENLVAVKEVATPHRFGGSAYFGFSVLTLVPIQTKMVDYSLMTPAEVAWLDAYHAKVREQVAPRLQDRPAVLEWMLRNTRPLKEQLGITA